MSRLEFYIKSCIIVAIGCVGVLFSDTEAAMISDVKWVTASIGAYVIWRNGDFMPKCCIKFINFRRPNTEIARHPPSGCSSVQ